LAHDIDAFPEAAGTHQHRTWHAAETLEELTSGSVNALAQQDDAFLLQRAAGGPVRGVQLAVGGKEHQCSALSCLDQVDNRLLDGLLVERLVRFRDILGHIEEHSRLEIKGGIQGQTCWLFYAETVLNVRKTLIGAECRARENDAGLLAEQPLVEQWAHVNRRAVERHFMAALRYGHPVHKVVVGLQEDVIQAMVYLAATLKLRLDLQQKIVLELILFVRQPRDPCRDLL